MKTTLYGDVVIYRVAENIDLEVRVADETVWLSQAQMAMLFGVKENTVTYHIKEIYKIRELDVGATARKIRVVRNEGNRTVNQQHLYHFGASFKDLGKRLFVVSKIEEPAVTKALMRVFS